MPKLLLLPLLCSFLLGNLLQAQTCKRSSFIPFSASAPSPAWDTAGNVTIQTVDAREFAAKLQHDREANPNMKYQLIVTSSTGCSGMLYGLININKLKANYGDSLGIYWIVGNSKKDCDEYNTAAYRLARGISIYSCADKYVDKTDDRVGSDTLAKELFPDTKNDIIYTPKYLLLDCKTRTLIKPALEKLSPYECSPKLVSKLMDKN